ncbi:MAG: serine/threonine protein kinase [Spirochaetae bacterium HGW-Spirochaetae-9]|nr:MAG: serine/threonine protein kinase [Spirochaetae bacterium HGW-Spirochaetae-9]
MAGRYAIEAVLGTGDIAVTYAGRRLSDDLAVVIREFHFDKLERWKSYELFERELRTLERLRHSALPVLLEHFEQRLPDSHRFYLVSERIPGQTLADRLRGGWRPTEVEVRDIADQLLRILEFLQDQDPPLVHRDIKPSNIVINDAGKISLIDFGAVQEAFRLTSGGGSTVIGTFGYMAPEQAVGKSVPASDLYGLGATLVHLLAGRSPAQLPHQDLKIQFADQVRCSRPLFVWLESLVAPRLDMRFAGPWQAREVLGKLDRLPVTRPELLLRGETLLAAHDLAIAVSEDVDGLHLRLRPMFYDYRLLLPLLFGGNLVGVPMLLLTVPTLGPLLALLLPLASLLGTQALKRQGALYQTSIRHRQPDGFFARSEHDSQSPGAASADRSRSPAPAPRHPVSAFRGSPQSPVSARTAARQPDLLPENDGFEIGTPNGTQTSRS